jgi:hypothetical protein
MYTEAGKGPQAVLFLQTHKSMDTVGKHFEKILLTRVLREIKERGLLRDEQFAFRHRYSTTLQLDYFLERFNRNLTRCG